MKKPEGKAEAGWYDHPTEAGYEKYWNGKFWSKNNRLVGEEGVNVFPHEEKFLGRFLFRYPVGSDGVFIGYLIISILSMLSTIRTEFSKGLNSFGLIAVLISCLVLIPFVYLIFLVILIPRRIIDKRNGLVPFKSKSVDTNFTDETIQTDMGRLSKQSKNALALFGVLVLVILVITFSGKSVGKSDGDLFFEEEQRISSILSDWNQGVAPLVTLIQDISNGSVSISQAQESAAAINADLGPVLIRLNQECEDVPNQPITAKGQERAIQLSWKMLRVTCDIIPQQYTETLAIYRAQISPTSTQFDIDKHVNELNLLVERKKQAVAAALEAMTPYATDAELENIKRMKEMLGI